MINEMTSKERVLAMLNRKPVDRIPVISGVAMLKEYIEKTGAVWPDYHSNAEMMVNIASCAPMETGIDNLVVAFGMFVESAATGLDVKMGRVDIHPSVRGIFKKPEDVKYDNFLENKFVRTTIDAIKLAKERYPDVATYALMEAPITLLGDLMGAENLAILSYRCLQKEKYMEKMQEWLSVSLEISKIYAEACAQAGADAFYCSDASASPNLLMPEFYYKVAGPSEKELGDFIHENGCPWELHICGNTTSIIEGMAATGANCLSIDQTVDMGEATKLARDVPVVGNVTPLLMVDGTEEQIIAEVRKALDSGAKASKLGCGTPPLSTSDRLKIWVKAAADWSAENL
ncbi:uroporphyrinogen decarboxylase family protein [Methanosarcina sp. UBA411]|uniref:uroporphyrinogen decarboxylase family protein n=1 Tax=Methanosarcina sp. UBA411 TaxID=1915589 RepID=UPI002601160F|nr:uroporphyrinogen decarboxylase family protein [Methanosarcina sp. UBA411]